jgi:hypothetical protein
MDPATAICSPGVFEKIRRLNQAYRADILAMVGQQALSSLEAEKARISDQLRVGHYGIPNDLY